MVVPLIRLKKKKKQREKDGVSPHASDLSNSEKVNPSIDSKPRQPTEAKCHQPQKPVTSQAVALSLLWLNLNKIQSTKKIKKHTYVDSTYLRQPPINCFQK